VRRWLVAQSLELAPVLGWIDELRGFCDREVVANAGDHFVSLGEDVFHGDRHSMSSTRRDGPKRTMSAHLPGSILLVDRHPPLCRAWVEAFASFDYVEVVEGDFFARDADAMVSPANSFGIMDAGLDLAIREELGVTIQSMVQKAILERHHGELAVGAAEIVPTLHERWPWLVVAPTMRVPENIGTTLNAYVAFRAILLAIARHNGSNSGKRIRSVLVPGLGTGIGRLDPRRCAAQMRMALDQVSKPARIPSYGLIHELHRKLRGQE
jgi:O-acetyl-ADP-ribose deacetylase (regulator of RNase III)